MALKLESECDNCGKREDARRDLNPLIRGQDGMADYPPGWIVLGRALTEDGSVREPTWCCSYRCIVEMAEKLGG